MVAQEKMTASWTGKKKKIGAKLSPLNSTLIYIFTYITFIFSPNFIVIKSPFNLTAILRLMSIHMIWI